MQTMLQSGATKLSCVTNLAKHLKDQQPGLNEEFREVRKAPISTSLKYYLSHLKGIVVTDVIVCLIFIFEFFFFYASQVFLIFLPVMSKMVSSIYFFPVYRYQVRNSSIVIILCSRGQTIKL